MTVRTDYAVNRMSKEDQARLVAMIPQELLIEIDQWGVAEGFTSRRQAVTELLCRGLHERETNA